MKQNKTIKITEDNVTKNKVITLFGAPQSGKTQMAWSRKGGNIIVSLDGNAHSLQARDNVKGLSTSNYIVEPDTKNIEDIKKLLFTEIPAILSLFNFFKEKPKTEVEVKKHPQYEILKNIFGDSIMDVLDNHGSYQNIIIDGMTDIEWAVNENVSKKFGIQGVMDAKVNKDQSGNYQSHQQSVAFAADVVAVKTQMINMIEKIISKYANMGVTFICHSKEKVVNNMKVLVPNLRNGVGDHLASKSEAVLYVEHGLKTPMDTKKSHYINYDKKSLNSGEVSIDTNIRLLNDNDVVLDKNGKEITKINNNFASLDKYIFRALGGK